MTHYRTLGLEKNASSEEIKRAYRKLSLKYHPDHNQGDTYFAQMFRQLREAYEVLNDPLRRQAYDLELERQTNGTRASAGQHEQHTHRRGHEYASRPPTVSFSANKSEIAPGEEVTLSWDTSGADSVEIRPLGAVPLSGTKTFRFHQVNAPALKLELVATNRYGQTERRYVWLPVRQPTKSAHTSARANGWATWQPSSPDSPFRIELSEFFSAQGRLRRRDFWLRTFVLLLAAALTERILDTLQFPKEHLVRSLFAVFILVSLVIQGIKRLHDLNKSGWCFLWWLVPLMNLVVMWRMAFEDSDAQNTYGPNPKA